MAFGMEINATVISISTWKTTNVLDALQIQSTIHKQGLAIVELQPFWSMEIVYLVEIIKPGIPLLNLVSAHHLM